MKIKKFLIAIVFILAFTIYVDAQILQKQSITLSDSQVKNLPSTPVEIIAAPGANKVIVPIVAIAYFKWNGNYGNIASNAALNISHNNGTNLLTALFENASSSVSNLLNDDEDYMAIFTQKSEIANGINVGFYMYPSNIVNKNITIGLYNGANGNLTGGSTANTIKVTVYYVVEDVS